MKKIALFCCLCLLGACSSSSDEESAARRDIPQAVTSPQALLTEIMETLKPAESMQPRVEGEDEDEAVAGTGLFESYSPEELARLKGLAFRPDPGLAFALVNGPHRSFLAVAAVAAPGSRVFVLDTSFTRTPQLLDEAYREELPLNSLALSAIPLRTYASTPDGRLTPGPDWYLDLSQEGLAALPDQADGKLGPLMDSLFKPGPAELRAGPPSAALQDILKAVLERRKRNSAVQSLLQQINIAEMRLLREESGYVDSSSLENLSHLARFDFRPDPKVAFAILEAGGEGYAGFVAVAAHAELASNVYVYDNINATGVTPFGENYRKTNPEMAAELDKTILRIFTYDQAAGRITAGGPAFTLAAGPDGAAVLQALPQAPPLGAEAEAPAAVLPAWTNSLGMEFLLIPAGEDTRSWADGLNEFNEPVVKKQETAISRPYYLGKYEVTQEQWAAVMGDNPSEFKNRKNPVENVSWADAYIFIRKLNKLEKGKKYRLPTEAEWEHAARAGTKTALYFGDALKTLNRHAWSSANSQRGGHPAGEKKPNPWGLHDIYGNVWEWVQDWHAEEKERSESRAVDPAGPEDGESRVARGCGWRDDAACYPAARRAGEPWLRANDIGFRLALEE